MGEKVKLKQNSPNDRSNTHASENNGISHHTGVNTWKLLFPNVLKMWVFKSLNPSFLIPADITFSKAAVFNINVFFLPNSSEHLRDYLNRHKTSKTSPYSI